MDIGPRVKKERVKQQIPRAEMAKAIGKSLEFVAKAEIEKRRFSIKDLAIIAKLLGRPMDFFTGAEEESQIEKELVSIMEERHLDAESMSQIQKVPRLQMKKAIVKLTKQQEGHQFSIIQQEIFDVETEVFKNGDCRSSCHSKIKVIDWEMPTLAIRDIRFLSYRYYIRDNVKLLEDECRCRQAKLDIREIQDVFNVPSLMVLFQPPLRRDDIADICYEVYYKKAFMMNCHEIKKFLKEMKASGDTPKECLGIDVFVPTDLLRSRISFPKDYEIDNVESYALISNMRFFEECDRLKKEQCLSKMRVGSRWVLELKVHRPKVGTQYFISWRPTKQGSSLKSFSNSAREIIVEAIAH